MSFNKFLDRLTHITTTMDTHFAYQIFFPSFWVGADDLPLSAFREISTAEIDRGLHWAQELGVRVDPLTGDVVEGG